MKVCVMCSAVVVLLASVAIVPAQTPSSSASRQPAQPQRTVQVPADLPPPVGEEMRVKANDIDALFVDGNVVLLDVREPWELEEFGTREGYVNIPLGELEKRLDELPKDKTILTA